MVACRGTNGWMGKALELLKGQRCKGDPGIGLVARLLVVDSHWHWYIEPMYAEYTEREWQNVCITVP